MNKILTQIISVTLVSVLTMAVALSSFATLKEHDKDKSLERETAQEEKDIARKQADLVSAYRRGETDTEAMLDRVYSVYGVARDLDQNVVIKDKVVIKPTTDFAVDESEAIEARFKNSFKNNLKVVYIPTTINLEDSLKKVDLGEMSKTNLVYYTYIPQTNTYHLISNLGYKVDSSSQIVPRSQNAGYVVISDGGLEK